MNDYEQQGPSDHPISQPPTRPVGGWLMVYCLLTIVGIPKTIQTITATKAPLMLALYLTILVVSLLACFTVWLKASSALTWVGFALAIRFLFGLIQIYLGANMTSIQEVNGMSPSQTEFTVAAANILGSVIWFLYFHTSTRVRETLGRNL